MGYTVNHLYILSTIAFTVYGQLVIKWQVNKAGNLPFDFYEKIIFLLNLLLNPWIISAFIALFCAALSWMMTLTKFELSHAYPFMGLTFVLVLFFSGVFLNEVITMYKAIGILLVIIGLFVGGQG